MEEDEVKTRGMNVPEDRKTVSPVYGKTKLVLGSSYMAPVMTFWALKGPYSQLFN